MPNPGKLLFLPAVAGGAPDRARGGPRQVRNRRRTCWCRENLSNGIQVRDVPESIDGTLKPGGHRPSDFIKRGVGVCGGATDGRNGGSAPSSPSRPGRSGSPRRTGTAGPTTTVLDADVVIEPLTERYPCPNPSGTYSRDATTSGQLPGGHARLPAKRSAQGPLIGRMWELCLHVTARDGG
jgi:hypothetical protein